MWIYKSGFFATLVSALTCPKLDLTAVELFHVQFKASADNSVGFQLVQIFSFFLAESPFFVSR
jgi:hypothetical protein